MNEIQQAAFTSANSGVSAITPQALDAFILGVLATVVMLWFCWVCVGAYRASGRPGVSIDTVGSQALRALFVMVIVLAMTAF